MQLTIVKPDNLVIVDKRPARINLTEFPGVPENLHALQWQDNAKHIEYTDEDNEALTELPLWVSPLIEQHQTIIKEEDAPPPEPTEPEKYRALVNQRDQFITETDWLVQRNSDQLLIGVPTNITYDQFTELQHWRQALRGLDEQYKTSDEWVWPEPPGFLIPRYMHAYP